MPKRKRSTSGMSYKKKRKYNKRKSNKLKKAIMKTIYKVAETKSGWFATTTTLKKENLYTYNLMYECSISNGTTSDTGKFIGDQIYLTGVRVRYNFATTGDNGTKDTSNLTMWVIKSPVYVTTLSLSVGDLFHDYTLTGYPQTIESSKAQVVYKKTFKFVPQIDGAVDNNTGIQYIPIKRRIKFSEIRGSYDLKGYNYYLCFYATNYAASANEDILRQSHVVEVFYKDV